MVRAPDDEALVREAQRGSLASFNALVERYQTQLYNLALRHVGDRQLAEDVTQEAFLSAWRAIRSYRGGSFRAWLFRILVNEARDLHRRSSRRPANSLDAMLDAGLSPRAEQDVSAGPDERALTAETIRAVERCLRMLPEDQRVVVLLSDVQGLSYDEIGRALGLPLGTVKSRLNRGRVQLRRLLVESGEL